MRDPETTRLLTAMALESAISQQIPFQCCAWKSFELRECDARLMSEGPLSRRLMKPDVGELDGEVELRVARQSLEYTLTLERGSSVCSVRNLEVTKRERVARLFFSPFSRSPSLHSRGDSNTNVSLAASQSMEGVKRLLDVHLISILCVVFQASGSFTEPRKRDGRIESLLIQRITVNPILPSLRNGEIAW